MQAGGTKGMDGFIDLCIKRCTEAVHERNTELHPKGGTNGESLVGYH